MSLNIVLLEPEIPNNTGNIGRLSLASGSRLHLIEPLGFDLGESKVRRAGLDYWKHVDLHIYKSWEDFIRKHPKAQLSYLSSHGTKDYTSIDYNKNTFLVFGKESVGLPKKLIDQNKERTFKIPLFSQKIRSLNLANAISIVVYEGIRQNSK